MLKDIEFHPEEARKHMIVNKGRRALLAKLVDMPLAAVGLELATAEHITKTLTWEKVDTNEYANSLEVYCDTWQQGTTYKAAKDVKKRVSLLEHATLYSPFPEKTQHMELLCRYQMLVADLVSEQTPSAANGILTQTIELSGQEQLYDVYAYALRQRAGTYIDAFERAQDYRILTYALEDFQASEVVKPRLSPFYQGLVDIRRGLIYAWLAQDSSDFQKGLKIIDASSTQIGKQSDDKRIAGRLDRERYWLNRASAYLYSPQGSPKFALSQLNEAVNARPDTSPRRGVHRDLLFAETYTALGNYPMAVAHASAAVEITSANGMDTLFNQLENVYQKLRKSTYGNSTDVARLGVQIMQSRHPELFI